MVKIQNFTFELHAWFKISPCKREDFLQVAFELQSMEYFSKNKALFYRHVETRWLILVPVLEKVLERWEVSKEYFLEYLPKRKGFEKGAATNERYKRISTLFKRENVILVQIAFLIDAAIPFQKFLTTFQFEGPLIHILFKELKSLLKSIMLRFIDPKILEGNSEADLAKIVVDSEENQLSLNKIVVRAKTGRSLKKLSAHDTRRERTAMKNVLVAVSSYLQEKLPLQDKLLISAACLHPVNRKKHSSGWNIEHLASLFPHVVKEEEISKVRDEWMIYGSDDKVEEIGEHNRVDHWWRSIFKMKILIGERKYPMLEKLIKSVLSLDHANSAVERSLSGNSNTVQTERNNMLEETIISLRRMKEHARSKGGAENVVMPESMLNHINDANRKDDERLRREKEATEDARRLQKQKEEEHEKKKILGDTIRSKRILEEKERAMLKEREKLNEDFEVAQRTLTDASACLQKAIVENDGVGIKVASEMIATSQRNLEEANKTGEGLLKSQTDIGKKRKSAIDNLFSKMKKN